MPEYYEPLKPNLGEGRMKTMKAKLGALIAVLLLMLSPLSFAAEPVQPNEEQLSAAEPVQLSMAEMDDVTAAGDLILAPTFNISIFYNYGILQIGNVQGYGGNSYLLGAAILNALRRL
jgi:hypothetical protein